VPGSNISIEIASPGGSEFLVRRDGEELESTNLRPPSLHFFSTSGSACRKLPPFRANSEEENLQMPQLSRTELALVEVLSNPVPETALSQSSTRNALRRCRAAWHRTYKEYMKRGRDQNEYVAAEQAGRAYCNAMPLLTGHEGIRDFIACAAHGILIGAIPAERGGQLLYAAQVALGALARASK
jgi:hypothetical protein